MVPATHIERTDIRAVVDVKVREQDRIDVIDIDVVRKRANRAVSEIEQHRVAVVFQQVTGCSGLGTWE